MAAADLEPIFRERPAIHRFPGWMAGRVHDLAVHVRDEYDGDAERVCTGPPWRSATRQPRGAAGARGDEDQGARSGAGQALRGRGRHQLVPWRPTLGDVDSPQALANYQAAKRVPQGRVEPQGSRGLSAGNGGVRWIALEGAANARVVVPGALLRSDNLQSLTPPDVQSARRSGGTRGRARPANRP